MTDITATRKELEGIRREETFAVIALRYLFGIAIGLSVGYMVGYVEALRDMRPVVEMRVQEVRDAQDMGDSVKPSRPKPIEI